MHSERTFPECTHSVLDYQNCRVSPFQPILFYMTLDREDNLLLLCLRHACRSRQTLNHSKNILNSSNCSYHAFFLEGGGTNWITKSILCSFRRKHSILFQLHTFECVFFYSKWKKVASCYCPVGIKPLKHLPDLPSLGDKRAWVNSRAATLSRLHFQRSGFKCESMGWAELQRCSVCGTNIYIVNFAFDATGFKRTKERKKRFKQIWIPCFLHLEKTLSVISCQHAVSSPQAKGLVNHINNMSGLDITDCLLLSVTGEAVGVGMEDVVG